MGLRGALVAAGLLLGVAACQESAVPLDPSASSGPAVGVRLELSDAGAAPGERIAVAVHAAAGRTLAGLQGALRFDAARLRYLGQTLTPHLVMVGDAAPHGAIRWLAVDIHGLPPQVAVFAFEVRAGDYAAALWLETQEAVTVGLALARTSAPVGPLVVPGLVAEEARILRLEDWYRRLAPGALDRESPGASPGQYLPNLRFGDVTLNGVINVFDVANISNLAVGNLPLLTDATQDYVVAGNVAPFNLPGLGEVGDAAPPGRESNGSALISVFDVVAVANEAVGNDQPVAGELIPGREPLATSRVVVSGILTADRTLTRDTIYELQGLVIVQGGTTLTIEAGTRIEGDAASRGALAVYRGANIIARGTPLQPIVFTCTAAVKLPGCWGGVALHGFALLNRGTVPDVACPEKTFPTSPGNYGGCIDQDTSGLLRFVRIEYAGQAPPGGNPVPGLAMLGVGSGTVVDSVQVHRSLGDGLFVSGGTLSLRSIVLTGNLGDGLSWADGWTGRMQFVMIQQDAAGGHAIRGINEAVVPTSMPRSSPQLFHVTISGLPAATSSGLLFDLGTGGVLRDLVVLGPGGAGLDINHAETCAAAANGQLHVDYSIFFGGAPDFSADSDCIDEVAWATDPLRANRLLDPQLIAPMDHDTPDLRPLAGSAPTTGFLMPPSDGFFDLSALFAGAVAPANGVQTNIPWYAGWTVGW